MNRSFKILAITLALSVSLSSCSHIPSWMGGSTKEIKKLPGDRLAALPVGADLKPDEAAKAVVVSLPVPTSNDSWAQHTGVFTAGTSNIAASGTFEKEQSTSAGDGQSFEHTLLPRPVVGGDMVFAMDAEGKISAHDAANLSTQRWLSEGVYEDVEQDNVGGGLAYDNGKLYATSGRGRIAAFDASSGKELWHMSVKTPLRSAPRIDEGRLYAITIDSAVYALDTNNGNVLWNQRGISETAGVMNSISPAVVTGAVIVPYASGEVYMLASGDGHELWTASIAQNKRTSASDIFTGIGGDPVIDGQVVFAVSNGGGFSVLSVDQGQPLWSKPIASNNTPWVSGDYVFLLTTDNTLVCMMKYDGRVRWSTRLEGYQDMDRKLDPITWRGPVLVSGKLVLVNNVGQMALVNAADGTIAETRDIPSEIETAPVVAGGRIYLVSKNATLYSFE